MDHDHLVERIAALEAELGRLKAATTRREIFKKLAVAGAGAVAGATVVAAEPAGAADGSPLLLGSANDAINTETTRTLLTYAGPAFSTPSGETNFFQVRDDTVDLVQPDTAGIASYVNTKARTAVLGYSQNDGVGVSGVSEQGFGVIAFCRDGVGGHFQGGRANVNLPPFGAPPPQRTDAHLQGEFVDDRNGDLWLCVDSGSPGIWRKLAGRFSAGQLHLLPSPLRVYDSRPPTSDGPLATGAQRTVNLSAAAVVAVPPPEVPLQPSGALISLTITQTVDSGFLAVFANGAPYLGNSNINWYADNQVVAVTTVTAVDAAQLITVLAGGPAGATTQFVVDVIGYYG
jgi:hypothetical protein